jgi:hypothetical protein
MTNVFESIAAKEAEARAFDASQNYAAAAAIRANNAAGIASTVLGIAGTSKSLMRIAPSDSVVGLDYLTSTRRIDRFNSRLQSLVQNGYANGGPASGEKLAMLSGRIEMLRRGYVLEGNGQLVGTVVNPGMGRGRTGIDRIYRSVSNPDDLVPLESKYSYGFSGNAPLNLLGDTNYGKQMSTQWMDRKIDQMMFGPHGDRINSLGQELFLKGYQGRYMNVLNGNGVSYFYDLQALGLK